MMETVAIYLAFVLMLSIFLGFEVISRVPSTLHTPLMSGSNAISGITLIGALTAAGTGSPRWLVVVLGVSAVALAAINVVAGYVVTDRMLAMFKKKKDGGRP
jgi:NAD(P) transhydrogenase subunit alpha